MLVVGLKYKKIIKKTTHLLKHKSLYGQVLQRSFLEPLPVVRGGPQGTSSLHLSSYQRVSTVLQTHLHTESL